MLSLNPIAEKSEYDIKKYHNILEPQPPEFLNKYYELPMLQRLKNVGLLCGTDWTPLYKNRFYYSRFDHSVGVALIIWHFTHDKAQTISGLLHDVSTPVFSHVSDFRKGDALTQTETEGTNESIIRSDRNLAALLAVDGLRVEQVEDYHKYPIADNKIPQLSSDRLEYMFPSGMALDGSWDLPSVRRAYEDLEVLRNEEGLPELGFKTLEIAEDYTRRFCMIGHILQLNENKLTLHLLRQIMNKAVNTGILAENDFMEKSEAEIMGILDKELCSEDFQLVQGYDFSSEQILNHEQSELASLYKTFRTMTKIEHTQTPLDENEYFCINLKVKQRYINPLVKAANSCTRISEASSQAKKIIEDFLHYNDTPFGCVKLIDV
ncbi:MAG: hypothetical protein K6G09_06980 [Treponema sp.]|nr:hypothetical protein [Treponema sp.]